MVYIFISIYLPHLDLIGTCFSYLSGQRISMHICKHICMHICMVYLHLFTYTFLDSFAG